MALTENQETTMATMAEAFRARMEELFPLPEEMSEQDKATIRANWEKLGQAVAAILPATMTHRKTGSCIFAPHYFNYIIIHQ